MPSPDAAGLPRHKRRIAARGQFLMAGAAGVVVGVVAAIATYSAVGVLIGWDAAAAVYLLFVGGRIVRMDAEQTAEAAVYEDPTRAAADVALLGAATASLAAVGVVLASAASKSAAGQDLLIALGVASVVLSWSVVHTVYALRYAGLYYTGPDGGIDFNEQDPPDYRDFLYLALTIGMTFQVSDTELQSKAVRRTAVRHALLSYLFGAGILATTVNLVASLTTR